MSLFSYDYTKQLWTVTDYSRNDPTRGPARDRLIGDRSVDVVGSNTLHMLGSLRFARASPRHASQAGPTQYT